jgi:Ca2+/Na+ antiporter
VNLLAIMGITAAVSPAPLLIPTGFLTLNLPLMVAAAVTLAWAVHRRGRVGRRMGTLLLATYLVFVVALL